MATSAAEIATAPVIQIPEIGSTNEEALARAQRGESGPLFIVADVQTSGRGRQGRVWASPPGNLYASLLLTVTATAEALPQLSHVAAVALVQAIRSAVGRIPDLAIKWPNDVLVGRAKLAGILVEATTTARGDRACVIGWGVNCAHSPDGLGYATTHLAAASGRTVAPADLLCCLKTAAAETVGLWNDGAGFAAVRSRWLVDSLPFDTVMTVRSGSESVEGRFQGIDGRGRLLLMGPYGPMVIEAGDVILNERSAALAG